MDRFYSHPGYLASGTISSPYTPYPALNDLQRVSSVNPKHGSEDQSTLFTVRVDNLSRQASDVYLHNLFSSIGVVVATELYFPALPIPTGHAKVSFATQEEALHALAMNGWNAGGINISITAWDDDQLDQASIPSTNQRLTEPERKNLYVLNLPLDTTNDELVRLFSPYGNVSHTCILAILDSCARRRGFILMGSGEEATRAMKSLHGKMYRDHYLDVSYSVVQKTAQQGYRTSEDSSARHSKAAPRTRPTGLQYDALRTFVSGSSVSSGTSRPKQSIASDNAGYWHQIRQPDATMGSTGQRRESRDLGFTQLGQSQIRPDEGPMLVVENLTPTIFATSEDIAPVFQLFGELIGLELYPAMTSGGSNAAIVKYRFPNDADQATRALNGQFYGDREIRITLIDSPKSPESEFSLSGSIRPRESSLGQDEAPVIRDVSQFQPAPGRISSQSQSANVPLAPARSLPLTSSFDPFKFNTQPFEIPPISRPSTGSTSSRIPNRVNKSIPLSHPGFIHLPSPSFPPPPHTFADTLTPREHYSTSPLIQQSVFGTRPKQRQSSKTDQSSESSGVSEPKSFIGADETELELPLTIALAAVGGESNNGRWIPRRASLGGTGSSSGEQSELTGVLGGIGGERRKDKQVRIQHPFPIASTEFEDGSPVDSLRVTFERTALKDQTITPTIETSTSNSTEGNATN
ncbi:Polyadenylate-binding protein (RRM superfamily) [Phaffia rhodozyma]|uniref:Polyadenylate-binding protein (RRM superfamily) n=1 Tax=Phaffia rhodozyma TaxID=264483 RepID=A0A0F7SUN9_PHARH|nr:Polyadenylate-binding protein (RRM superfamily) [Phaffia rhodozyma]